MAKYLFIPVLGEIKILTMDEPLRLHNVYELLGCDCIETVRVIRSDIIMLVDESGKIKTPAKLVNPRASMVYPGLKYGDYIVGDVLIAKETIIDGEPDIGGLSPLYLDMLCKTFNA